MGVRNIFVLFGSAIAVHSLVRDTATTNFVHVTLYGSVPCYL